MNIKYDFSNKNVVVTGGAQGIGFQVAKDFLNAGASVTIWDYSEEGLSRAEKELSSFADRVGFQQVDVSSWDSCEQAAERMTQPVNVLINNAGITRDKSFKKMTSEDFEKVVNTNLTGLFNVSKALLGKFAEEGHKSIVNLSSVVALYGNFGQANYVAAKSGVIGLTKTLARELGRKGFSVNAVAPGFTKTAMIESVPKENIEKLEASVPVNRLGEPTDISNACLFLSSDNSAYINGTTLSVDGGLVV